MTVKKDQPTEITVAELARSSVTFAVLGTSPLICNRMSAKARQQLLAPAGRKSTVEKQSSLKHEPLLEYRDSPYRMDDPAAPTLLAVLPSMFKAAMCTAALRIPGVKRTEIEQLVQVNWDRMPVWGVPKLFCAVTRSADINKTPDVRTRAILPQWATYLTVHFMRPQLREQAIVNLLAAAGQISGIGDWRAEKGSGAFGSFTLVGAEDAEFKRILAAGGRDAQAAAMETPEPYDSETEELMSWFDVEARRRGFRAAA
jgi:hypothetical protein